MPRLFLSTFSTSFNYRLLFLSLCALEIAVATKIVAAEPCGGRIESPVVGKALASASSWANLRNQEGSIRYESARLVDIGISKLPGAKIPEKSCTLECPSPQPALLFKSVPNKFLSSYSDQDKCEQQLKKTQLTPIKYTGRRFKSLDDFNDWYADFSQGKGKDGTDLYQKCDGSCSPQYHTLIRPKGKALEVDASVICGPARDKDDNQYRLSYAYVWTCGS